MIKKIYEGYHCRLEVRTLLFDNDSQDFVISHECPFFSPKIIPVPKTGRILLDFSNIISNQKDLDKIQSCISDVKQFCNEFLKRRDEFGF